MSSRHLARSIVMQSLYEWDFYNQEPDLDKIVERNINEFGPGLNEKEFVYVLIKGVVEHLDGLDDLIQKTAPQWELSQISLVNRNVLRIGLFELLYANKEEVPPKVAINEAIELAKNFGNVSSGKFVNGVLGTIFKEMPEYEKKSSGKILEEDLAGAVVYKQEKDKIELALVLDAFGFWTLTKGHCEEGETPEQTITREIKEEIGLEEIEILEKLGDREYIAKDPEIGKVKRKVQDFLVKATGNTKLKVEISGGIKDGKWFDINEVMKLKIYEDIKPALLKAIDILIK